MSEEKKTYEAMFLVTGASSDFQAASQPIRTVLDRNEAELLSLKPWDDRRLAYEIGDHRRGLYALAYFKADPERIKEIEHDCQLAEDILRLLVLSKDKLTEEELAAETPASASERRAAEALARSEAEQKAKAAEAEAKAEKAAAEPEGAAAAQEGDQAPAAEGEAETQEAAPAAQKGDQAPDAEDEAKTQEAAPAGEGEAATPEETPAAPAAQEGDQAAATEGEAASSQDDQEDKAGATGQTE